MRVGFDARMISHPGIGRYIKNLLSAMLLISEDAEFLLYGKPENLDFFKHVRFQQYCAPVYSWAELFNSPFTKDVLDIVHIPHFNAPFRKVANLVVTVHDFTYLKFPKFSTFLKGMAVKPLIANTIKNAKYIIAISENTKKDIIESFPVAKSKIRVIYEAADPVFHIISDETKKLFLRRKYNLTDKIILYVGSIRQHKNIARLIDAYLFLKSKGIRHRLVLVGRADPKEVFLLKRIKAADVIYLGEVPAEELVIIYNLADLFVLPSLYEGFGLPVLEAMACGVPVIVSSAASLPEVVGDAGIMINPQDKTELTDKMYAVIANRGLREELVCKGLERVNRFSWHRAAQETLQVYKEAFE